MVENLIARAIKSGQLPKLDDLRCTNCGKPAAAYDHRDYNKPLEVEPVCDTCNSRRPFAIKYDWEIDALNISSEKEAEKEYMRKLRAKNK